MGEEICTHTRDLGIASAHPHGNCYGGNNLQASLIAQLVKNQPAIQETPVQFLGTEDPLEKE